MDYLHLCLAARVAHGDLVAIHTTLEAGVDQSALRVVLLKAAMLAVANVADLEVSARGLYKDHPVLSSVFTQKRKQFEFCKYLRNKFVGHLEPELSAKTFEWKPELNALLTYDGERADNAEIYINYATLETAINTFVDAHSQHKLFESDTDLNYPPDLQRFLNTLGDTVLTAIKYTESLLAIAIIYAAPLNFEENLLELALKAGKTEFNFLVKKR